MPESSSQNANNEAASPSVPRTWGRFISYPCYRRPESSRRVEDPPRSPRNLRWLSQAVMRYARAALTFALLVLALRALTLVGLCRALLVFALELVLLGPPAPQADHRDDEGQREQKDELAIEGGEPVAPRFQIQEFGPHGCTIGSARRAA